jgi:hypothetical protein
MGVVVLGVGGTAADEVPVAVGAGVAAGIVRAGSGRLTPRMRATRTARRLRPMTRVADARIRAG